MLKKIEIAQQWLHNHATYFRCPICQHAVTAQADGLICSNKHQFDLSKKGTLYFLNHGIQTDYNKKMFTARGQMIQAGMYEPLLTEMAGYLFSATTIVDVGCGEGSFLHELTHKGLKGELIGFDLSKAGIYLASNQPIDAFWCVADLTNLPFANNSMDVVLNIFSPSHYREFQRVLAPDGLVIKVIPEVHYLKELRQAFYPDDQTKQSYSNNKVRMRFSEELHIVADKRITYRFEIPQKRRLDLLEMSPLEWQVAETIKQKVQQNPLEAITIDVRMLVGRKN
ncbi:methyltransferase domain-containing protein [Enterococcus faecalis]